MKAKKTSSGQLSLLPQENLSDQEQKELLVGTVREVIRVESVLSKLPMHCLAKREAEPIHFQRNLPGGKVDLYWDVSPSMKYGMPGILAYQIDTLVINKRIDEAGRPLPVLLRLGTLRSICQELGLRPSGTINEQIRAALYQSAGAMITAKLTYTSAGGQTRRLEAGFRRYDVIFTGERLPDGQEADAVYIIPGQVYASLLNDVPVRPLDFSYLKMIPSPSAQRWYEVASFKVYAALRNGQNKCWLDYSEYCLASAQKRYYDAVRVQKQMYKIHRPHITSAYINAVSYEPTLDSEGNKDWRIWYEIGDRALSEYKEFNRVRSEKESQPDTRTIPAGTSEGEALVKYFLHLRFGAVRRDPSRKESALGNELARECGPESARELITQALEKAGRDNFQPLWMTGLERYLEDLRTGKSGGAKAGSRARGKGNAYVGQSSDLPALQEEVERECELDAFDLAYKRYLADETRRFVEKNCSAAEISRVLEEKKKSLRRKYPMMPDDEVEKTAHRETMRTLGSAATIFSFSEFRAKNAHRAAEFTEMYKRELSIQ